MDSWRKFNVAGFFSLDMVEHVRPFLARAHSNSHLLGLMLELLHGTEASTGLQNEFRAILLDTESEDSDRQRAYQNIVAITAKGSLSDFDALVVESTSNSLNLAPQMLVSDGVSHFGRGRILDFVRALAKLYPNGRAREIGLGPTYFARRAFSSFSKDEIQFLLDEITANLKCVCGKPQPYACTCRQGASKIAGLLLDLYSEIVVGPRDPRQIRRWTERLIFTQHRSGDHSASVAELTENSGLRRAIQILRVGDLSDPREILDAMTDLFMSTAHSGLHFYEGDYDALVDHAFATENHALWRHLVVTQNPYETSRRGTNPSRSHMRAQARTSPAHLRIWSKADREHRENIRRDLVKFGRSRKRIQRREVEQKASLLADFEENRTLIEAGRHWGWLKALAQRYLNGAHADDFVIDEQLIERALLNCFDFLSNHVPVRRQIN